MMRINNTCKQTCAYRGLTAAAFIVTALLAAAASLDFASGAHRPGFWLFVPVLLGDAEAALAASRLLEDLLAAGGGVF